MKDAREVLGNMMSMLAAGSPPDLALVRHCGECEFHDRCREQALEKDDLSLLSSMKEKERKKLNSEGIFARTSFRIRSGHAGDPNGCGTNVRSTITP